jgi:hypothetical protein
MPKSQLHAAAEAESTIDLTPEQIKEIREKRAQWYNEQIAYLDPQLKYQQLVTEIEQLKAIAAEAQFKQAQIYLSLKAESTATEKTDAENAGTDI